MHALRNTCLILAVAACAAALPARAQEETAPVTVPAAPRNCRVGLEYVAMT